MGGGASLEGIARGTRFPPRVDVLGVEISAINPEMAIDIISGWVEADAREYVCVRDVHGVVKSLDDPELRRIHSSSGLVTPDGMPLVWLGRLAGARSMRCVYGPDLTLEICSRSVQYEWSHFS
jgi:N-acetylglucosaminyldiphosphoundecaprenol N-acetyl-beta-D-mannosaminyltransferase